MFPALEPVWSETLNIWLLRVEGGPRQGHVLGMDVLWEISDPHNDPAHRITIQGTLAHHEPYHFEPRDWFMFGAREGAVRFGAELELRCEEYAAARETKNPRGRKAPGGS